ncbi:hypothetical protein H0H87_007688 [Tephrocybe sp. NHM501043]|nr:hypothetical protein H0H87_007688 [Tephrocybe sp. NHM501043]
MAKSVVKMRVKHLWNYVPLPANSKLVIRAFTINADAAVFLNNTVMQGNAFNDSLPILHGNTLHLCSWVPGDLNLDGEDCPVVWNGTKGVNTIDAQSDSSASAITPEPTMPITTSVSIVIPTSTSSATPTMTLSSAPTSLTTSAGANVPTVLASTSTSVNPQTVTIFVAPASTGVATVVDSDDDDDDLVYRGLFARDGPRILAFEQGGKTSVNVSGISGVDAVETLDSRCLWTLNWPLSVLDNTKREDIVFIAFQFWVLGMSVVALLNESIPHILASLVTHMMATAWAAFQIKHTAEFKSNFTRVITEGACSGVSLLPAYWHDRGIAELASLAFNILALLTSSFLTWKLFKLFGWQTFKRVGASLAINRIYKIVLTLSITIQLSMFFMVVTVSLWIDQLFNSAIGDLVDFETLYKVSSFITLALLIPWLMTGWFAVRRELRLQMFIFLLLSVLYLGGWSVMFFSTTFRWTFVTWRFFSIMATASVLLTVASLTLGVICRYNFGKGLLRYLNAQQNLPGDDFEYYGGSDIEKVDFPSNEKPIPTYAVAFGTEPSHPHIAQGPRFFDRSAAPFETVDVTIPPNAYTITKKNSAGSLQSSVTRSDTRSSDKSMGSLVSFYSYNDRGHGRSDSQKRWVIE